MLEWLKEKNYALQGAKSITKAHLLAALNDQKDHITDLVRNGGDKISKSTTLKEMVRFFKKYDVCVLHCSS